MDTFTNNLSCEEVYKERIPVLDEECGVTDISLLNAKHLHDLYGLPTSIYCYYGKAFDNSHDKEWLVDATYSNGRVHRFTGFSWGYYGEGVRGLETFLDCYGGDHIRDLNVLAKWKKESTHTFKVS